MHSTLDLTVVNSVEYYLIAVVVAVVVDSNSVGLFEIGFVVVVAVVVVVVAVAGEMGADVVIIENYYYFHFLENLSSFVD